MRHAKRDFLKTDDIKHSMEKLSIPVTLSLSLTILECFRLPLFPPLHLRERPQHRQPVVHQILGNIKPG